jgi:FkbM family methyltransferase
MALRDHNIDLVFDIGANSGQFATELNNNGYRGQIVCIEPQLNAHKELEKRAEKFANWHVYKPVALGSEKSLKTLNLSKNSVSSSFLPVGPRSTTTSVETSYVGTETVQVITFDELFTSSKNLGCNYALKIDSQGYEMEILEGSKLSIDQISMVILEMSLTEIYVGGANYLELITLLENWGFELWDLYPGFRDRASGQLLQADGLFIKNQPANVTNIHDEN